jgi:uncharacterized protein (TIGR00369 family)
MSGAPPDGFVPWERGGSAVTDPWEPIYTRDIDGIVHVGTHVRPEHCNRRGLLHGGVIASLADIAMGYSYGLVLRARGEAPDGLLTTHLALEYIAASRSGWLEIRPRVVHPGRSSGATDATIHVDGFLVARVSATFRVAPPREA